MNRNAAIRQARKMLQETAIRVNKTPVFSSNDNGDFIVKIGKGGLTVRMAINTGAEGLIESADPGG